MTVRCEYCKTEHEYDDPKELDVLVYLQDGNAVVFCDAECWLNEMLFRRDQEAAA